MRATGSARANMSPGVVPIRAGGIDDAAVGLENLLGTWNMAKASLHHVPTLTHKLW